MMARMVVNRIPAGFCHVILLYWLILPSAGRNRVKYTQKNYLIYFTDLITTRSLYFFNFLFKVELRVAFVYLRLCLFGRFQRRNAV